MPAAENFRRNLATAMEAQGITQVKLAAAAGMVQPYVSRVLRGETQPQMDQAERLAKAVGFPLAFLIGRVEDFSDAVLTNRTK